MSIYHDDNSQVSDMIRDISDKHCPDSIRESAYSQLNSMGIDKHTAQEMADTQYGDFWG